MRIEILGDGCRRCKGLKNRVTQAVKELGLEAEVESVMDPERLAESHALSLPGLMVDGELHPSSGSLSVEEIKEILKEK